MIPFLKNPTKEEFLDAFYTEGYVCIDGNFSEKLLKEYREACMKLIELERELLQFDKTYHDYGFVLCMPYYLDKYPFLLDIFTQTQSLYLQCVEWILEKWFTLHLFSCNCLEPLNATNKAASIHIDSPRILPDRYCTFLATMINLDDYTETNGATLILPRSQREMEKPEENYFYQNATKLVVPKGTITFFNPRVWHATGINNTEDWRTCLLVAFCKPWVKQRVDIPSFMKHIDTTNMSDELKQLLGFKAQMPTNFREFYGEPHERAFTQPHV